MSLKKESVNIPSSGSKGQFLSVLPLKNVVALPKSIIPVVVGREVSIKAVDFALSNNKEIFVTAQKQESTEHPTFDDVYAHGTRAHILQVARMPNGSLKILIEGVVRSRATEVVQGSDFIGVYADDIISKPLAANSENQAIWRNIYTLFKRYSKLNEKVSKEILGMFKGLEDIEYLSDTIAVQMRLNFDERQRLLEMSDLKKRVLEISVLLLAEIEILEAEQNIRKRVQNQVEKNQKDYYLNEQMRAIQSELGRDDIAKEVARFRKEAKKLGLSKEAVAKVNSESRRLEQMPQTSPEASVSKNYIDWLLSVPWSKATRDSVSLKKAEEILNASHAGMKKAKERIIEFLAAKKFAGAKLKRSPIICLAGAPGVGKTSLAQSVADALGRKMVRISLGGMRDEAEIRGHRRTYIGAMPGKIIQAMKKAGVINPVIVLDEIDKMSMDFRGDPASALLEVLDPEQNKAFSDYFLEIDYDLSKVMFITTANVVDAVPYALLDRMDVIQLSGYTEKEKVNIAQKFLLPKLLSEHALTAESFELSDVVLDTILDQYTREAGVRQLNRVLAKLVRKWIQEMLLDKKKKKIDLNLEAVHGFLGRAPFKRTDVKGQEAVGLVTGLAWTEVGGDVLEIEVSVMKGKGGLSLTGQMGEVMQESVQAAFSYIRSRYKELGLKESFHTDCDIHVHVPEGGIPKDGPSAGITMATALISALTKTPIRGKLAMTGEITLRGRVLGIGGLKEKVLAAARLGFATVIAPTENKEEYEEFCEQIDVPVKLHFVSHYDEVIDQVFAESPLEKAKKKKTVARKKTTVARKKTTASGARKAA